jgi:hypothetical protein
MLEIEPVVPELDLIRHPFSESVMLLLENLIFETTLLDLPPMEPILRPLCGVSRRSVWGCCRRRRHTVHLNKSCR